jgi:hypothetical protein
MSQTGWIVVGAVVIVGAYLYYKGQTVKGDATKAAHPGVALNTLAAKTPEIIRALDDAFSAEHTTVNDGYRGYF